MIRLEFELYQKRITLFIYLKCVKETAKFIKEILTSKCSEGKFSYIENKYYLRYILIRYGRGSLRNDWLQDSELKTNGRLRQAEISLLEENQCCTRCAS